jgi:energy-coupling factor transporter ATP-binding protein EcfA2
VDAHATIDKGESLCILGPPGTGKSTLTCELVKKLRARGDEVVCAAKTHVAASRLPGGISANHFANAKIKRGRFPTWLVLDEISMLDTPLWAQISRLAFCGTKCLLVGDWNQFTAINDKWCGLPTHRSAENSSLLHAMAQGNVCRLAVNRRSDPKIFDFCGSIVPGGSRAHLSMQEKVGEARTEFPATKRRADYSLVISHAKRRRINAEMNLQLKPKNAVLLKAPTTKQANAPQDGYFWPGMKLVGCMDTKRGLLYNGGWYEVLAVDHKTFRLKAESGSELDISAQEAMAKTRMTWALCYACVQGLTLPGRVRLHDVDHPRMDWRKLNVGISRGTRSDLVEIASDPH